MLRILMDSAADCAPDEWEGVSLMPLTVTIAGQDYRGGVDLTADEFYERLTTDTEFPKTSQPSPQAFVELFEAVEQAGDELLYLCLSSSLSGTIQSAQIAKEMVGYEGIHVVDTRLVSHGIRLLVQRAVELRDRGVPAADIVTEMEALRERVRVFAAVDTLEYLHRGGRLSRAAATVGEVAGLKPLVTITPEGNVAVIAKCLGRLKALTHLQKLVDEQALDPAYPLYSLYTYGEENCQMLEKKLSPSHTVAARLQVGSTIGAHVGPGVYGVLCVVK